MRRLVRTLVVLLVSVPAGVGAKGYVERLASDDARLRRALKKRCPGRSKEIAKLHSTKSKSKRRAMLSRLEPCGRPLELYHLKLGSAHVALGDFKRAETSYRSALSLRVTESAQVGLLIALVRQNKLSVKQKADLRRHLRYFRARSCQRADLCAALSYVAWHLEQRGLTRRAAGRAISLGFAGWQPYFFGGSAYLWVGELM